MEDVHDAKKSALYRAEQVAFEIATSKALSGPPQYYVFASARADIRAGIRYAALAFEEHTPAFQTGMDMFRDHFGK